MVCQNHLQWVRRNTFTATFLNFSGLLVKFPWQQRKINFRVEKTAKNVCEEQTKENICFERRTLLIYPFSPSSSEVYFLFLNFYRKLTSVVVKTATYVPLEDSWGINNFLKNCTMFQPSSDFHIKKVGPLVEKIFFRVFLTGYRAFRGISWGKQISLSKKFFSFWYHFSRLSNFFVVLQFFQSVVSKQQFTFVEKRNCES